MIELINWLVCFVCPSEELRVVVIMLADWVANSSPPWDSYHTLMSCRLISLDKSLGLRFVGIREMLHRTLTKLIMRASGDQENMACGNLQMCKVLEDGI